MKTTILLSILSIFSLNITFGQLSDPILGDDWDISQIGINNLLNNPYDIEIGPDGYLWITERTLGQISRFDPATGVKDQLIQISSLFSNAAQDGLMGLALHPQLGKSTGNDYVYAAYTYDNSGRKLRISRFTYSKVANDGTLSNEFVLIEGIPASNDHNSGRLAISPDLKLYYTVGDQGSNQFSNACNAIRSQILPTSTTDYINYPGKILRLNLDGTIPTDNPTLAGVKSHVYSYGHRNVQGLAFGTNGKLYGSEHGPKSDDEINIIQSGKNYGWPHIAGYNDDKAYEYCNWSSSASCATTTYGNFKCPAGVSPESESSWTLPANYVNPITTWGTVPDDYDFKATCSFVCWPSIAPSGIAIYEGGSIPNWGTSLLTTALKRGRIYRSAITADGNGIVPVPSPEPDGIDDNSEELWYTQNRYRDIVAAPDGTTFYIITDSSGSTSGPSNDNSIPILNPGIIIKVKYVGKTLSTTTFNDDDTTVKLIPNPAKDEFTIDFNAGQINLNKIQIIDVNGRIVFEADKPGSTQTFNVSKLQNGLYFVSISNTTGEKITKKLIVSK